MADSQIQRTEQWWWPTVGSLAPQRHILVTITTCFSRAAPMWQPARPPAGGPSRRQHAPNCASRTRAQTAASAVMARPTTDVFLARARQVQPHGKEVWPARIVTTTTISHSKIPPRFVQPCTDCIQRLIVCNGCEHACREMRRRH